MIKQIFVRNGEKFVMAGNKIRLFKKDLAEKVNLPASEIEIIHNCIIMENHQMIKHYNIPFDVEIWFGKLSEYLDEFGSHIIVTLKADYNPNALAVTEKVLLRVGESIFRIRKLLKGPYSWIEKVDMWNSKKQLLKDDQTIEECGLLDDPVIILKSPIVLTTDYFKIVNSSTAQPYGATAADSNDITFNDIHMKFINFSLLLLPLIEVFVTYLDKLAPNGKSNMSKIIIHLMKDNKEVANENPDFSKLISETLTELTDKIENILSEDELLKVLDLLASELNDPPHDKETAMTLQQGLKSFHEIIEKLFAINERYPEDKEYPRIKQTISCMMISYDFMCKSIEEVEEVKNCPDKIVNGKMLNYFNSYLDVILKNNNNNNIMKTEGPIDDEEIAAQNSFWYDGFKEMINLCSTMFLTLNNMACQNVHVIPNLNKDDIFRISSGTQLTTGKVMKTIPVTENTKEIHLITSKYDTYYDDDTALSKNENIAFLTLSRLDNLEIMETLGTGAYGVVKKCRNKKNNHIRALKIIKTENDDKLKKLIPEIFASFKFATHSRIIKYFDYYKEENNFFIEMEYMEGGSLREFLIENKNLGEMEIRHFCLQILEGLKYLHQMKTLLHGDITPANILLDKDKNIKIADFGFAKDCKSLLILSREATERYQAPEIATSETFGSAIDIWAFGIIVIQMVLGDSFNDSNEKCLVNIKTNKPNSSSLCSFIECCLKEDPNERWNASELLESDFMKSVNHE